MRCPSASVSAFVSSPSLDRRSIRRHNASASRVTAYTSSVPPGPQSRFSSRRRSLTPTTLFASRSLRAGTPEATTSTGCWGRRAPRVSPSTAASTCPDLVALSAESVDEHETTTAIATSTPDSAQATRLPTHAYCSIRRGRAVLALLGPARSCRSIGGSSSLGFATSRATRRGSTPRSSIPLRGRSVISMRCARCWLRARCSAIRSPTPQSKESKPSARTSRSPRVSCGATAYRARCTPPVKAVTVSRSSSSVWISAAGWTSTKTWMSLRSTTAES